MKRTVLFVVVIVLAGASFVALAQTQVRDLFSVALSPAQQRQCGLDKLAASERAALARLFSSVLQSSELGDSAVAYLKDEGWEEVKVLGTRRLKLDEFSDAAEYVIAEKGAWTYILEPKTLSTLQPGTYLGEMGFTSCEIIDTDGDTVGFWTKETK